MDGRRQLGEFLRTRRSQLSPETAGLTPHGDRRRVPGLRREELALLAGVSASYYARLEQGYSLNASAEVLDAIAGALGLDDAERRHLHNLAGPRRGAGRRRPVPERLTPATRQLVAALADVPVVVLGRRGDVLAWNRTGHALHAGHLDPGSPEVKGARPNMTRLVFTDAHTRELYPGWQAKARDVVGNLRLAAGQHPDDPLLASLVGELSMKSPEFAALWSDHRVRACGRRGPRDASPRRGRHDGHPADPAHRAGAEGRGRDGGAGLGLGARAAAPRPATSRPRFPPSATDFSPHRTVFTHRAFFERAGKTKEP